ncbi:protease htpX [Methanobacterium lacus]|uniref:Protease HtpX homolog n=1 Tax=Methanobacterium lacus (strain AL-21) TaxID=877455 RepID=F0T8F7_METLA|nr:M48 family metallopeptidase [Methanobacterium lacus]ADZ09708.1 protease htpX [Methanobacterium lacus]
MDPIYSNIAANKRWTYLFFLFYALMLGAIGYTMGIYFGYPIFGIGIAALVFILAFLVSYYGGQGMVTRMAGAKEVSHDDEPYLYNTVDALSIAAGIPMPKLYMINTDIPNAFAAGRSSKNSSITVTKGLLETLDRLELEGVIAHEISHIKNYDVLLSTVAIVLAGTIVFLGFTVRYSAYGGLFRGAKGQNNPAGIAILVILVLLIILAPIFAQLLKFAISRKREFLADASGADLTGYPEGLASALEKISTMQKPKSKIQNDALNSIYIVSPAIGKKGFSNLYSTHPPTGERVKRLREMEFIDQKHVKPEAANNTSTNQESNSNNMGFVAESAHTPENKAGNGYLVCNKCEGYYELQPGESPDDFTDECECGGKLEYRDSL